MMIYKILYYTWDEYTFQDCLDALQSLGHSVDVISDHIEDYDYDEVFMTSMKKRCSIKKYDLIFTFNYFPIIARIAADCQLRYVSWIFDSPHLTLDSITLSNEFNSVFLFDHALYKKYRAKGIQSVHYMPLAYNKPRLEKIISGLQADYKHDITFLGTLYNDKNDFFEQIKYLPPYLDGFIHSIIDSQQFIYGLDLCDLLFNHEKCEEMAQYIQVDMGNQYIDYRDDLFRNMIRKKITVVERRQLLSMIGQRYHIDLYAPKKPKNLPVTYKGYAEYTQQMPEIFYTSKINLNITLRSILSGIPLRIMDVLGAHGFLLTNYQPELSEYFKNGEELVWFEDKEDLMDKIDFYLKHDKERQRIAEKGNLKVQQNFTYEKLLPKIFEIAEITS